MAALRQKMKVSEYRRECFTPGSAPDRRTVVARIMRGEIVGCREGRTWYVYPHEKPTKQQHVSRVIAEFEADTL